MVDFIVVKVPSTCNVILGNLYQKMAWKNGLYLPSCDEVLNRRWSREVWGDQTMAREFYFIAKEGNPRLKKLSL